MRLLPPWLSVRRWRNPRLHGASHDRSRPLPPGAAEVLRLDHPRLVELRQRYGRSALPMARLSQWGSGYLEKELTLQRFRGDNAYLWQFRNIGAHAQEKYRTYLHYVETIDRLDLLHRLQEDGLFGCWTFDFPGWPPVSRDLLDSVNELYFLERHVRLLQRPGMTLLDVGAGYGRLAWRTLCAAPGVAAYLCADAVPESTFLCEYYLRFRGCDRAEVLPLDELDQRLAGRRIDLAINVHSFSEMTLAAIDGWVSRLADLGVPWLFVVDHPWLRAKEIDGSQPDFDQAVLYARGYALELKEPIVPAAVADAMSVRDHFYLFRLRKQPTSPAP